MQKFGNLKQVGTYGNHSYLNIRFDCYDTQLYARQNIRESFIYVTYGEHTQINSQAFAQRLYDYKSILCWKYSINAHPHYDYYSCLKTCSHIENAFFSHVQISTDIHSAFYKIGATDPE
jgi:hypothetical protein